MRRLGTIVIAVMAAACGDLPRPVESDLVQSSDELYSEQFLPTLHLGLSADAMAALGEEPYRYVEGRFRYGPYTLERVGIRIKGSATLRTLDQKPAFKVKFNQFVPGQRFFGLESVTLNNLEQDPTMVREHLGYQVFRAVGVPAPRAAFATVTVNDEPMGLYADVESVDDHFLARNFGDPSGGLYEGDYGDDLNPSHVWRFEQDEGDDLERTDLLAFTQWIHTPGDAIFYDDDTLLDAAEFLSYGATEAVIGHWDGYWIAHNYRIYHEPTVDRWSFIPWGIDQVLRDRIDPFDQLSYLYVRCRESARCLPDFVYRMLEVTDAFEALDLEARYQLVAERIDEPARADPRKAFDGNQMDRARDNMVQYIRERPDQLRERIACIAGDREVDADGDGFGRCWADCDDDDAAVHPGAEEHCDGIDNDCSGNVDDDLECGCPEVDIDGVEFALCDLSLHWEAAAAWCEGLGGALASIDDAEQNDAVWQAAIDVRETAWWIGLTDIGRDTGDFYWIDGSDSDYRNWNPGDPNFDGRTHCAQLRWQNGRWIDLACGNARPFVCRDVDQGQ